MSEHKCPTCKKPFTCSGTSPTTGRPCMSGGCLCPVCACSFKEHSKRQLRIGSAYLQVIVSCFGEEKVKEALKIAQDKHALEEL